MLAANPTCDAYPPPCKIRILRRLADKHYLLRGPGGVDYNNL
jgi:hypothetical protein